MPSISITDIIGQPFPIRRPLQEEATPSSPFVIHNDYIYNDYTVPAEHEPLKYGQGYFPLLRNPSGPYIAPDGNIEACPSPEEATQWFPDDEVSLRVVDDDLRATVNHILLSKGQQHSSCAHFLACAIVKHFSYWLWLMKGTDHPLEPHTVMLIYMLKNYLKRALRFPGLTDDEKASCVELELFATKQVFSHFPQLCDWALDVNWATLAKLVDPRTGEPEVMTVEIVWGEYIMCCIQDIRQVLRNEWISLEFLCDGEFFVMGREAMRGWEAQKHDLKDLVGHCEELERRVEAREARVLQEVSGNAVPSSVQVEQCDGKENEPPVVEERTGDGPGSFPEWQERMLRLGI